MASSLQLLSTVAILLLSTFCFTGVVPDLDLAPPHDSFAQTTMIETVLANLGFQELARAVPSLSDNPAFTAWKGPTTIFAPTDASIQSCSSCSVARLLREHTVAGHYSHDFLRKLSFGSKIPTMNHDRCITVTSANTKIFIGGVEITHPDLFNNGLVVVHGVEGYAAPLSQFSCDRMASQQYYNVMQFMLNDAMLRLRNSGFSILALAMQLKSLELLNLQNMTVFAVDDASIFSGSHSYLDKVRFHIIPNRLLPVSDLEKISPGTLLPTLEVGQSLTVTTPMRINNVMIKIPDLIWNLKIVVHSIRLPLPHLHPSANKMSSASCSHLAGGRCANDFR